MVKLKETVINNALMRFHFHLVIRKKRLNDRYRAKLKANVLSGDATEQETMNRSKKKKGVATKDVDLHEM